jgi:hypothetical protein
MPRFVARPVTVEAVLFDTDTAQWPESFRLAVRRFLPDGTIEIMTGDGARPCRHGDHVVRGPSGLFSVWHEADFETWFTEQPAKRPAKTK